MLWFTMPWFMLIVVLVIVHLCDADIVGGDNNAPGGMERQGALEADAESQRQ
jgi:hypothetical protein